MLLPCAYYISLRELEEYDEIFNPDFLLTFESSIIFESSLE
jgi:hypothetical protein